MSQPTPGSPMALPTTWDLVADDYAAEIAPFFERFAEDALAAVGVARGHRVVDVAAGPGTLSLLAARRGAQVAALDFSEKMVAQLRARAAAAGLEVESQVGDGMALPYRDHEFDAGFSIFGLFMFPDRDRGFRELGRVVKPGGRVAVTSWPTSERVPAIATLFASLRTRLPAMAPGRSEPPLGTVETFRAEMEAAGLRDVSIREICHAQQFAGAEEVWSWIERTFAAVALLAQNLGDRWPPLSEAFRGDLVAALGPGPMTVELPAWLGVATA